MQPFKYKVPAHIAAWILFFMVPMLMIPSHEFATVLSHPLNLIGILIRNILWMALFYGNLLYLTPSLLQKKHSVFYFICIAAGVVLVTLINSRTHHFFSQPIASSPTADGRFHGGFRSGRRPFGFGPAGPFFSNLAISAMIASVSTTIVLWTEWLKARAVEQERAFQKIASELAVLKLQISPHFLFNTLNNIRWLIRSQSPHAEASVIKLSSLLRYVLYQTELEKVNLEKEAEHLQDYIALQKMRLVNADSILFTAENILPGQTIVPLLLIPLVENVFKYGEFSDDYQNSITMVVRENRLEFKTMNRIAGQEVKTGKDYGIGLENVRQRLALHYPQRHMLRCWEVEGTFRVELEILLD